MVQGLGFRAHGGPKSIVIVGAMVEVYFLSALQPS